jgi:lauroyl/myristoyl acyltransferase
MLISRLYDGKLKIKYWLLGIALGVLTLIAMVTYHFVPKICDFVDWFLNKEI